MTEELRNFNGLVDYCETADLTTLDANGNHVPDECEPSVLYVDTGSQGLEYGTGWGIAFHDLQDALAVAAASLGSVEEVRIAQGVYVPGTSRADSFQLVSGVAVIGGFAGSGTADPDAYDPALYVTTLSGDINGNDGPGFANRSDNSYQIMLADFVQSVELRGLEVRGGTADGDNWFSLGGALRGDAVEIFMQDMVFNDNIADHGGAIYLHDSTLSCERCRFQGNSAMDEGGAAIVHGLSTWTECEFVANTAVDSSARVGAVTLGSGSTVVRCMFVGNVASREGGAVSVSTATIVDSRFYNNSAEDGGALWIRNGITKFVNCEFVGNAAEDFGGAIYVDFDGYPELINSVVFANDAGINGGGIYVDDATSLVRNSILWGNSDASGLGEGSQVGIDEFAKRISRLLLY